MKKLLAFFGYMPIKDHNEIVDVKVKSINGMIYTYSVRKNQVLKDYSKQPSNERKYRNVALNIFDAVITDLKTML